MNFFKHKVLEALLLCRLRVPSNGNCFSFYGGSIFQLKNSHPFGVQNGHLSLVQKYSFPSKWQECCKVRCAVIFAVSEAQDERALLSGAEYRLGLISAGENDCIGSFKTIHGLTERCFYAHSVGKIVFHQVRDHFCVSSRLKAVTFRLQFSLDL